MAHRLGGEDWRRSRLGRDGFDRGNPWAFKLIPEPERDESASQTQAQPGFIRINVQEYIVAPVFQASFAVAVAEDCCAAASTVFAGQICGLAEVVYLTFGGCYRIADPGKAVSVRLEGIFRSVFKDQSARAGVNADQSADIFVCDRIGSALWLVGFCPAQPAAASTASSESDFRMRPEYVMTSTSL